MSVARSRMPSSKIVLTSAPRWHRGRRRRSRPAASPPSMKTSSSSPKAEGVAGHAVARKTRISSSGATGFHGRRRGSGWSWASRSAGLSMATRVPPDSRCRGHATGRRRSCGGARRGPRGWVVFAGRPLPCGMPPRGLRRGRPLAPVRDRRRQELAGAGGLRDPFGLVGFEQAARAVRSSSVTDPILWVVVQTMRSASRDAGILPTPHTMSIRPLWGDDLFLTPKPLPPPVADGPRSSP